MRVRVLLRVEAFWGINMRSLPVLRCGVYSAVCACAIRVLDNMAELPRAAVGARGHAGVGSLVLVRVSFQFLLIPPVPSLVLCLSLCVVGKVVLDMSNLAAISDMHGHSPLVCVRVFFSRHPLFFLSVSIPCAKRMPFPPLVYRDDISSSITSWHIAISCS